MSRIVKYPLYQWSAQKGLFAFTSNTTMFRISNIGSNKNEGITIDHYITRKMVLHHMDSGGSDISEAKFIELYNKVFKNALDKIITDK